MAFSESESSEKSNEYIKKHKNFDILNKEKDKKDDYSKIINDSNDEENQNNIKNSENGVINNKDAKHITKIYKIIIKTLESFIEKNYSNFKFVDSALGVIYSYIKAYLSSLKDEKSIKDKKADKENNIQKILYEFQIDNLNQQIKELKHEIELLGANETNKFYDGSPKKYKIYNYLKRKNMKLENKTKLDELKYLICIKDQQKKINELENKLKLLILENSKELKESKCFPNISKFNLKQHINPKSIPLAKSILKNTSSPKRNLSKIPSVKRDYFLTITNSCTKNLFKMRNYKENIENKENIEKKEKEKGKKFKEKLFKTININDKEEKTKENNKLDKKNELDIHYNSLKLNYEIIPNKDKNFFLSHPNLNIAGCNQRINKYKMGIPNKLFSFKFSKNIDKNAFYQFPSTLNEIFVELEKLRINTNNADG